MFSGINSFFRMAVYAVLMCCTCAAHAVVPPPGGGSPPAAPTTVRADWVHATNSAGYYNITWSAASGATSYKVKSTLHLVMQPR